MSKLNEFLTYTAPLYTTISKVEKILNVKLNEVRSFWGTGPFKHSGREEDADEEINGKEYFTDTLDYNDISAEQFELLSNIANNYGHTLIILGKIPGDRYRGDHELTVIIHKKEKKQKLYTELNLYVHGTDVPPEIISRAGLRTKNPWLSEVQADGGKASDKRWCSMRYSSDEDWFRIYMSALDLYWELKDNRDIEKIIDCILYDIGASGYGKYTYLIKLPRNYPVFKDPEGDEDMAWVFTTYPIPPKYILYIGYEDEADSENSSHPAVTREEIRKFIEG